MKKLLLAILLLLATPLLANQRAQGWCEAGNAAVRTQGLTSAGVYQASYPQCTVTVYLHGTTTLASIYSDNNPSPTPLANPFTANADGSWGFYSTIGHYDVVMSGGQKGGFPVPFTLSDVLLQDATAIAGGLPAGIPFTASAGGTPVTATGAEIAAPFTGCSGAAPALKYDGTCTSTGANLPSATQVISGNGTGGGLAMPEKGTKVVSGTPNTAVVAWNEDTGLGTFDCRDAKYDGGCLGPTPGLAMQDLANDIVCYNTLTGLHANTIFPPGTIPIGTPTNPTLKLPAGNYYRGASGGITGAATAFKATYTNVNALEFDVNLTATCGGVLKTDTLTDGSYLNFRVFGCNQGGCVNIPGDSTVYGGGGPNQNNVTISDSGGWVDGVAADHAGSSNVIIGGIDTHTGNLWGADGMGYYYFGKTQPPYNPSGDGVHCNICLLSLDGQFTGPNETYGFVDSLGSAYGHVAEVGWAGGRSTVDHVFTNEGSIGLMRISGGGASGHASHIRIDQPSGPGIAAFGGGDFYNEASVTSACRDSNVAWSSVANVAIATPGNAQTNGTYNLTGSGGLATTGGADGNGGQAGTNAVIQVMVAGGIAISATVTNPGIKYLDKNAPPTFTMTAGGTPATFTVTMAAPLAPQGVFPNFGFCDYVEEVGAGSDSFSNITNGYDGSFGSPDYSSGSIYTGSGGHWDNVGGFLDTEIGEQPGGEFGTSITPLYLNILGGTGPTPSVDKGGMIFPSNSSPTNITGVTRAWQGEEITVFAGDANSTLISTFNGGSWQTCDGYNINLGVPATIGGAIGSTSYHFIATRPDFGQVLSEQCDTIDKNRWWVNHAANAASLPPLAQQGTVDSLGDIRSHAIPAFTGLGVQVGGTPGPNGVGGTYTYAVRVWGVFGTQTSNAPSATQCLPLPGFVNNPCFQTAQVPLPEGWTHWQLYRETSTDGVATPGLIHEVTMTTPQHAVAGPNNTWADTRIAPINSTVIGTANYNANITGGPFECGTLPPVSSYPAILGQNCLDAVGGFWYHADATDHWKKAPLTFANF